SNDVATISCARAPDATARHSAAMVVTRTAVFVAIFRSFGGSLPVLECVKGRECSSPLSPPRLFVRADAARNLADDFVSEQRVRRMEAARARIAEQPLELALLEHAEAAREIERAIGDAERGFDRPVLQRHDSQEPVRSDPSF